MSSGCSDTPLELDQIRYRDPSHEELPHIVSFSGGRSSAAMAIMAARAGLLNPERGDLLVFANTSAEHPGTYDFAAKCKERIEEDFGLPFLWFEFCTVEDAWRGAYWRRESYRLVKPVPVEGDPSGYRSGGEVFEEMLCLQGMLPNPHSRTCTAKLKLYPAHKLLADWLGGTAGPAHAGHFWPEPAAGGGGETRLPGTICRELRAARWHRCPCIRSETRASSRVAPIPKGRPVIR